MDTKKILDNIDNINIDEIELADVEITEIEKERARKNVHKKIISRKSSKMKKSIIAASLAIGVITTGVVTTPVMASNIPVLGRVYEMLGIYDEYIDYTKYIGQSIEVEGGAYSIEEIMVTPYESLIAIRITGNEPISDESLGFMVSTSIGGAEAHTGKPMNYRIDEHNVVQVIKQEYTTKIPKHSSIKINIHEMATDDNPATFGPGKFELKVNMGPSYDKIKTYKIKDTPIEAYGVKLDKIVSTIMGTEIIGDIKYNASSESEYALDVNKLHYVLDVDGEFYGSFDGTGMITMLGDTVTGKTGIKINSLNFDRINSAEDIKIMIYEGKYSSNENVDVYNRGIYKDVIERNGTESNIVKQNGVTYKKKVEFIDGNVGEFYDFQRTDENIKFYYKGTESDIVPLSRAIMTTINNDIEKTYNPIVTKTNESNYIIEFNSIPRDEELTFEFNYGIDDLNVYSLIKEIDIR